MHLSSDFIENMSILVVSIISGIVGVFGGHTMKKHKNKKSCPPTIDPIVSKCEDHSTVCIAIARIETTLNENLPEIKTHLDSLGKEVFPIIRDYGERIAKIEGRTL